MSFNQGFRDELAKLAKEEKIDPSFFEKHPVATGLGLPMVGSLPGVASSFMDLAEVGPPGVRSALSLLGMASGLAAHWGPIIAEQRRLSKYLTPEELAASEYFTIRHPVLSGFVLPAASGFYSHAAKKELESRGLLNE